jgi:D-glycero-D-manno-heptose 1,7-bisphosphate phosphatase
VTGGRAAVFLDRDGVLNEVVLRDGVVSSPRTPEELVVPPGAPAAIRHLSDAGLTLVVVTNQPDLARGLLTASALAEMHETLGEAFDLAGFFVCPHDRDDGCPCRKPAPGLFRRAAHELGLRLDSGSWAIGDRWVDVVAGQRAGVRTALLERPWSWERSGGLNPPVEIAPDAVDGELDTLVHSMLGQPSPSSLGL